MPCNSGVDCYLWGYTILKLLKFVFWTVGTTRKIDKSRFTTISAGFFAFLFFCVLLLIQWESRPLSKHVISQHGNTSGTELWAFLNTTRRSQSYGIYGNTYHQYTPNVTGWWFGCHFLFSHILGISSSQLTNIFQRGGPTTNQVSIYIYIPYDWIHHGWVTTSCFNVWNYIFFRFPEMGMVIPSHHPFLDGIFPDINHPAIGVPPFVETSNCCEFYNRSVFPTLSDSFDDTTPSGFLRRVAQLQDISPSAKVREIGEWVTDLIGTWHESLSRAAAPRCPVGSICNQRLHGWGLRGEGIDHERCRKIHDSNICNYICIYIYKTMIFDDIWVCPRIADTP